MNSNFSSSSTYFYYFILFPLSGADLQVNTFVFTHALGAQLSWKILYSHFCLALPEWKSRYPPACLHSSQIVFNDMTGLVKQNCQFPSHCTQKAHTNFYHPAYSNHHLHNKNPHTEIYPSHRYTTLRESSLYSEKPYR